MVIVPRVDLRMDMVVVVVDEQCVSSSYSMSLTLRPFKALFSQKTFNRDVQVLKSSRN